MQKSISKLLAALSAILLCSAIYAAEDSGINIRHLSNEQNIIDLQPAGRYLLLPVEDEAVEGKVYLVQDNVTISHGLNIRLARKKVDYYVPVDLSAFHGRKLQMEIQAVPASSVCWDHISFADEFEMQTSPEPAYHHIPPYGWMNDPNGMFYQDGVYHLYYQYNPYGCTWGNLHWGHSTSTDLVHWKHEGAPLAPDAWGYIFSGSCVVDCHNTSGFGENAAVAFYTSSKPTRWTDCQAQSIAFSTDGGYTFDKYESNPVLISDLKDFRDPKVFWYTPGKHWVMVLAAGQEMHIYSSSNLIDWKFESAFGEGQGAHGGVWECPDLVELEVEGTGEKKWVLICNINPGGPFGGSATQYFVGSFNGKRFVNEFPEETKWMDWGKDNYATVTWSNAPDGRCIAIGWMSNWQYQNQLPVFGYRGANTIARELSLYEQDGEVYLKSGPVKEMDAARSLVTEKKPFPVSGMDCKKDYCLPEDGVFEIELTFRNHGAEKLGIVFSNHDGESVKMYCDASKGKFAMDRTESGNVDFSVDFPVVTCAPVPENDELSLRIFFDRTSVEIFGNDGEFVMTNLVFPSSPYTGIGFYADRGAFDVTSFKVYRID